MHNQLVTPAPRSALAQAIVVYLVTVALRVHICWEPGAMVVGGSSHYALGTSFGVMLMVFALLAFWAARLYPGLAR